MKTNRSISALIVLCMLLSSCAGKTSQQAKVAPATTDTNQPLPKALEELTPDTVKPGETVTVEETVEYLKTLPKEELQDRISKKLLEYGASAAKLKELTGTLDEAQRNSNGTFTISKNVWGTLISVLGVSGATALIRDVLKNANLNAAEIERMVSDITAKSNQTANAKWSNIEAQYNIYTESHIRTQVDAAIKQAQAQAEAVYKDAFTEIKSLPEAQGNQLFASTMDKVDAIHRNLLIEISRIRHTPEFRNGTIEGLDAQVRALEAELAAVENAKPAQAMLEQGFKQHVLSLKTKAVDLLKAYEGTISADKMGLLDRAMNTAVELVTSDAADGQKGAYRDFVNKRRFVVDTLMGAERGQGLGLDLLKADEAFKALLEVEVKSASEIAALQKAVAEKIYVRKEANETLSKAMERVAAEQKHKIAQASEALDKARIEWDSADRFNKQLNARYEAAKAEYARLKMLANQAAGLPEAEAAKFNHALDLQQELIDRIKLDVEQAKVDAKAKLEGFKKEFKTSRLAKLEDMKVKHFQDAARAEYEAVRFAKLSPTAKIKPFDVKPAEVVGSTARMKAIGGAGMALTAVGLGILLFVDDNASDSGIVIDEESMSMLKAQIAESESTLQDLEKTIKMICEALGLSDDEALGKIAEVKIQ